MSPDQTMMLIQTVAIVVQTMLGIAAILIARREVRKWRMEALGNKKIDLAIRLGKAALAVRDGFKDARNPVRRGDIHAPEYKPNSTADEKRLEDEKYDYAQRLNMIASRLEPLYEIRWEMSVLFAENERIEEIVKLYNAKHSELGTAMWLITSGGRFTDAQKEKAYDTLIAGNSGTDTFGENVEAITQQMLEIARKYTL